MSQAVPFAGARVYLLIVVLSLVPAVARAAADWPQFRGPGGRGVGDDAAAVPTRWGPDEGIAWKAELPGPGASSPVLVGDRIYLTCYTGYGDKGGDVAELKRHLVCLARADGKVRWTKPLPVRQPEQAKIREGHGYATNTPAADAERVYVFAGTAGVLAFDHDGKQLWQADVGDRTNGWGSAASPVLHGRLVLVNASVESDTLYALDRETGKQQVWKAGNIKESWNTPVVAANPAGKAELVVAVMRKVYGFDPDTGKPLWSCDTDINWYMAPSLVVHNGVAYCVGGRTGGALAVRLGGAGDVTASHRLWTGKKGSNVTSPVYHDGHLYWMHENDGVAYCADAATGRIVYEERLPRAGQVYASPVLAGGNLYYTNRAGRTFVLPAKPAYSLLATNDLEPRGSFDASPAVADGRIYMRPNKYLYCLGTKP